MSFHAHGLIDKIFCVTFVLTLFTTSLKATDSVATVTDTCGNELLTAASYPNVITSPRYPSNYRDNLICRWTVVTAQSDLCNPTEIYIHDLDLETCCDHLTVYNGPNESSPILTRLSGTPPPQQIKATGGNTLIKFTTDGSATRQGFKLSYKQTKGTPSLSKMVAVTNSELDVEMSVNFVSCSPYRLVHWRMGDILIQQDDRHNLTVTPVRVTSDLQPNVTREGFRATLRIQDPELQDFGLYRVTVGNSEGISESSVFLERATSVPTLHSYRVSSQDATIMVTFSSFPNFQVEWYKIPRIITTESDVVITTQRDGTDDNEIETEATYTTLLKYGTPREPNYGKYMCVLRNKIGTTEVFIDLKFPETELPHLLETAVQKSDQFIVLTVNFDSNIAYPTATWYHNNDKLISNDKYGMEMKWKNISSQDLLFYHYPSIPTSSAFERVITAYVQPNVLYKYPSIGGNRSFTQTNANYTAVLTISDLRQEDFGLYQIDLENGAGISRHVIEVTVPEVFNQVCDQEDTVKLVCHVTPCSSVMQSLIHSINDSVIRTFQGHPNDTTNTLTIPTCMYADAGTYTCVGTEEKNGRDVTIHHSTKILTVRAVPVILATNVTLQNDRLEIQAPFYSFPSHSRVTWQRNGADILPPGPEIFSVEPRYLNLTFHGKDLQRGGYVARLIVPSPTAETFGTYKVTVTNEVGSSEVFQEVTNPDYAEALISHDVTVSYEGNSALLNLTFTSFYPYLSVKWYFRDEDVQQNHPANKYLVQTDHSRVEHDPRPVVRIIDVKSSILTIMNVTEEDCGKYQVMVSNEAGQAVIPVTLHKQEYDIPTVVGKLGTNKEDTTTEIFTSFYSYPSYSDIRWFKEGTEISSDSIKYRIANEDIDIEISFNGETVSRTGTQTRLSMTSLNNNKSGLYTVQIYNDVGMTEQSITLNECT